MKERLPLFIIILIILILSYTFTGCTKKVHSTKKVLNNNVTLQGDTKYQYYKSIFRLHNILDMDSSYISKLIEKYYPETIQSNSETPLVATQNMFDATTELKSGDTVIVITNKSIFIDTISQLYFEVDLAAGCSRVLFDTSKYPLSDTNIFHFMFIKNMFNIGRVKHLKITQIDCIQYYYNQVVSYIKTTPDKIGYDSIFSNNCKKENYMSELQKNYYATAQSILLHDGTEVIAVQFHEINDINNNIGDFLVLIVDNTIRHLDYNSINKVFSLDEDDFILLNYNYPHSGDCRKQLYLLKNNMMNLVREEDPYAN